jgi:hypothetical protein
MEKICHTLAINTKTKNMFNLKINKYRYFIALFLTFTYVTAPLVKAVDPIYEDVSTAVNTINSPIKITTLNLKANGIDKTQVSFSLINSQNMTLLNDLYDVTVKASNGTLTAFNKDLVTGVYSGQFTTPTSGTESVIEATIKYKFYACEGVESAINTLDIKEKSFYDAGGFSLANSRITQLIKGISDETMKEMIYDQVQSLVGIDNLTAVEKETFSNKFYDLILKLKCFNSNETATLSKVIKFETPLIKPLPEIIPPKAILPESTQPKAETKKELKTFTIRTGGIRDGFIVTSIMSMIITALFILKNKKN